MKRVKQNKQDKLGMVLLLSFLLFTIVMIYASVTLIQIYAKEKDAKETLAETYRQPGDYPGEEVGRADTITVELKLPHVEELQDIALEEVPMAPMVEYVQGENAYESRSDATAKNDIMDSAYAEYAVDLSSLQEDCKDAIAWITIPGTVIDYVVAQGTDNEQYLHETIEGAPSKSGTLFLDYRNEADFLDAVSVIYGHNMRDRTMFGNLRRYAEENYACEHRIMLLQMPTTYQAYELLAVGQTEDCDEAVYTIPAFVTTEEMLDRIGAVQYAEENGREKVILSTCISGNQRRVVIFQRIK